MTDLLVAASQAGCNPVLGLRARPDGGKDVVKRCLCGECGWVRLMLARMGERNNAALAAKEE